MIIVFIAAMAIPKKNFFLILVLVMVVVAEITEFSFATLKNKSLKQTHLVLMPAQVKLLNEKKNIIASPSRVIKRIFSL